MATSSNDPLVFFLERLDALPLEDYFDELPDEDCDQEAEEAQA